ncbi:hypothetical protein tooticki91_gp024 [Flavobacterium phage vB_FspS_tooticki9-1]|uniref:Uncharacterized protein n=11 Tax=Caudoviricetes TaxID=2731619 RepID=A0A6B9LG99_9CAUD|nr:hypothetical protein HWC88_gp27 [Flavobacterium phage vB_FspS_hattifnatt9-1]YP_009855027.1 hypothetical protein HWC93_gp26 [Flavobacterium phage vB_FspS_mumin9-1]YP_009855095.1 hypothetical protein HWC94_gp27 [Flavobacterium phage vB_FspS_mymlan6-1]YP_009855510.1 hypothetical protein HWD00_gp24 [Flavobacterium phage vB_FspS_tooticki6-1]QHB39633.1 hypothetical protein mumin61_gp026 [Flavobacterium phage vB_FspS_mumin6-1]QHB39700.1 hypothetical protein mumin62_gp026 [Flavobacterium phage vB_F
METKKRLKIEAKKRGFVKGNTFSSCLIDKEIYIKNDKLDFEHFFSNNVIYIQGFEIYNKGEWAKIISYKETPKTDSIVESVVNQFKERSKRGIEKYGTTLQENNTDDFLQHFKEELMDAILYIQKLQSQRNEN